jgi:4a-hydroxytetrahydrobiopterin dehydratase
LTLVQTGKIEKVPIILVGENYWKGLEEFFKENLLKEGMISPEDTSLYTITDHEDKILEIIKSAPVRFGVKYDEKDHLIKEVVKDSSDRAGLSHKHCVPCEGGTLPLSHEQSEELLQEVSDWHLEEDKEIIKTYEFKDFREAMDFMNEVAHIAEKEGHHPDIKLHDYKKVDVRISTHAIGGLSENDFILAAKVDELLRK